MKNLLICILSWITAFFALAGCNQQPAGDDGSTTITGNMQRSSAGKIYFYSYADSVDFFLARTTPLDSAIVDEQGNFSFKLKINTPHVFSLQHGNRNLVSNLLISKGDQLQFKFYGNNNIPKITPFGDEAKFNTFLLNFVDTFYNDTTTHNEYYIASNYMDAAQFAAYNDRRKKNMIDYFNRYFENDSLQSEYRDYALQTICYELASDRLMYLWKKRMKGESVAPDSSFFNFTNPSFVENEAAFITPSYIRFLNLYIKDTYERMVEKGELPVNKTDKLIPPVEKYKLANTMLTGKFREAVLYNIILNDQHDVSREEIASKIAPASLDRLITSFKSKYSLE